MNKQPIEQAQDADLRLSLIALRRAAERAQALARDTETPLVISRNGSVDYAPLPPEQPLSLQESPKPYADKNQ